MDRRTALIGFGAAGLLVAFQDLLARGDPPVIAPTGSEGLRVRADRKGLLIGAAVRGSQLRDDPRIAANLVEDANILVPEIGLKWAAIEQQKGVFNFSDAEAIYSYATDNRMKMRGHTLTWYRDEPEWAQMLIPTLSPGKAGDLLEDYVAKTVGHWKGRLIHWDVANEAIDGHGRFTEPLWSAKLGETYLDIAFRAAHAADPKAMLVFNTDQIEMNDPFQEQHRNFTLDLLERLLKRGVPIHALGVESHLWGQKPFSQAVMRRFLDQVVGMGLKVVLTEFDVSDRGFLGDIAARDAAVASLGKAYLDVCLSYHECQGLLSWTPYDRYSWQREDPTLQRSDGSPIRSGLHDDNFERKPLWNAVASAIDNAPGRSGAAA